MDQHTPEFQYVKGQMREHFGALLSSFEQRNGTTLAEPGWEIDLPYGEHKREVFDLRPAGPDALGTVVYFHAGYWQSRDKSQFRFLAPAFNALGWHMALVNYPLCPDVTVADIVASAFKSLQQIAHHQRQHGRSGPMVLCGHSAGAHLAVEMALRAEQLSPLLIAGVVAISGVFDLHPLVQTSLNERLKLDENSAKSCSPLMRVRTGLAPAIFVVGATETPAFLKQSQDMAKQWQKQGNQAQMLEVAGADHFSVLEHIANSNGQVAHALHHWAGHKV